MLGGGRETRAAEHSLAGAFGATVRSVGLAPLEIAPLLLVDYHQFQL